MLVPFVYQHIQLHSKFLKESCWHVPGLFHPFTRKARSNGPVAMLLRKGELVPWHQEWPCMEYVVAGVDWLTAPPGRYSMGKAEFMFNGPLWSRPGQGF